MTINMIIPYTDGQRHLVCTPYSIKNLHRMAAILKLPRHWFHKTHYDIPKRKLKEIEEMSVMVSPKDIVRIIKGEYKEDCRTLALNSQGEKIRL